MCKKENVYLPFTIVFLVGFVMSALSTIVWAQVAPAVVTTPVTTTAPTIVTTTPTTQNWAAMPPYNTLWPLWSPALSPVNPATGQPTPLVTSLTPSTVLPVQPGLTWHFALGHPWLLYNTPMGMAYYDPFTGIDLWPPDILMNSITGLPITITLPPTYSILPPTPAWWILQEVPAANWEYVTVYPSFSLSAISTPPAPPLSSLLTPSAILL
ncbi:MAG: hypothetical protein AB1611_08930 [bacterium]